MSKKTIFTVEELVLLNDSTIVVKPLPIKKLRAANRLLARLGSYELTEKDKKLSEVDQYSLREEKYTDQLVEIVSICANFEPVLDEGETVEDVVDADTAYKIIEVATGVKLNDENLMKMAQELQAQVTD